MRSAYKISASGGAGQTIAVDDEGGYPTAEADLAKYRARYGLPPCTKASGCFKAVNSKGEEANYPAPNSYWEPEDAIDLDMASTACPECHVMIVETSGEQELVGAVFASALERGDAVAVKLGATEVSNSWGGPENSELAEFCEAHPPECKAFLGLFSHPGVVTTAGSGDWEYDSEDLEPGGDAPSTPASLPGVIAVGATQLTRTSDSRGWSERVWSEPEYEAGTGSGCTAWARPSWQSNLPAERRECTHRMTRRHRRCGSLRFARIHVPEGEMGTRLWHERELAADRGVHGARKQIGARSWIPGLL